MKNFKKLVALGMTAVMLMGNMTAFAAETTQDDPAQVSISGNGTESYVDKEVFKITVPTNYDIAFDFAVDPAGLVNETKGAEFGLTSDVTDKGVFFKNLKADGSGLDKVSNTSDKFTVTNKSSIGVTLVISANMVDGTDDEDAKFTGTFSSTPDFGYTLAEGAQKTADKAAALYFGLRADNEPEKDVNATEKSFNNSMLTAYDKYEVKYEGGAYTFKLKADAADFPTYSFQMFGQLNFDAADSNWTYVDDSNKTKAKTMPAISIKFTPIPETGVKKALVYVDETNYQLWVYKTNYETSDGKFDTKPSSIFVNGKEIDSAKIKDPSADSNYVIIDWNAICDAWGYDPANVKQEDAVAIWGGIKTVKVVVGSESYYGEVAAE